MTASPLCAVVVPSHDRPGSLELVLAALAGQTVPAASFEVIVVLDGPSPRSEAVLARFRDAGELPLLRWLAQPQSGQAAARNAGARAAEAPVLIFLDDDVVPEPDLVAVHLRHHAAADRIAVLGDSRFVRRGDSYYHLLSWVWWEDVFAERAVPGRPPNLADFCAGNVSLRRDDFLAVGGFDPAFTGYGGEDYELGHRLLQAGVAFVPDRAARAAHHHEATVAGVLRKTRQEARGDLVLVTRHPELHGAVRMGAPLRQPVTLVARLAIQAPWLGDPLAAAGARTLGLLERGRLRHLWLRAFKALRTYAYWRGVRDAVGSWDGLRRFRAAAPARTRLTLDVTGGLPDELPGIPAGGAELAVTAGGRSIGTVVLPGPPRESARAWLARELAAQLGGELASALPPHARGWWLAPEGAAHG